MNNKNKKRLGILLVIFGFILSGISFAYWASGVSNPSNDDETATIIIGEGNKVATTLTLGENVASNVVLVPNGRTGDSLPAPSGSSLVETVTFALNVEWESATNDEGKDNTGTLNLSLKSVKIDNVATHSTLVNVTLKDSNGGTVALDGSTDLDIVVDGAAVVITVEVTLTEPTSKAIYDAIAGKTIALEFEAEVVAD